MMMQAATCMKMDGTSNSRPAAPKTPQDRENYRRSLHKGSSPAWKTVYRKRCLERLKTSREKFLTRFRSTSTDMQTSSGASEPEGECKLKKPQVSDEDIASSVQEVMLEEWEQLRVEHHSLPKLPSQKRRNSCPECSPTAPKRRIPPLRRELLASTGDDAMGSNMDDEIDYVLSIMDELTKELIKEEQAILAQYEVDFNFSEDALCAAIESLSTNDVICPICQKNLLHQNMNIIFCSCGMRLDTAQDGITLDYIRHQLEDCCSQHSTLCSGTPVFSLETTLDMQNIIMNCTVCDFMEIIV